MGTSHVPFAMPAGRVVHPSAPDGGDALPIVARPPQPPLPATQRVWRSCMARALHPTSKPSPPAHSASAYMPQPPSPPPEPPADSPSFHEHPARLDAQAITMRSKEGRIPCAENGGTKSAKKCPCIFRKNRKAGAKWTRRAGGGSSDRKRGKIPLLSLLSRF